VPAQFREHRRRVDFRQAMDRCPQPILAAVNGFAFGGGLELALACDIRVAAASAQMGLTEINLAIIPGGGGTQRLPRLVGRGKALEMILTGARIPADEALRIGLVERVVPAGEALKATLELARAMAAKAPVALRYAKEAVVKGLELPRAAGQGRGAGGAAARALGRAARALHGRARAASEDPALDAHGQAEARGGVPDVSAHAAARGRPPPRLHGAAAGGVISYGGLLQA